MRRFIAFLAAVLVAWPAIGLAQSVGIGRSITRGNGAGYTVRLDASKTAGTYVIGEAFPKAVVGFELGSAFVGTLYACETTVYAAGTCTAYTSPLSSDITNGIFDSTRRWYLLTITTAETGSDVSYLNIYGGYEVSSSGGGRVDADGNGKFEAAPLWDADADGSPMLVSCTAKDDPFPQCKFAGHLIVPDFFDDANCAMHNCGNGQLERGGTLYLGVADYIGFPCWDVGAWMADASTPGSIPSDTSINDPRGSAITRRDDAADASKAACPVDSEGSALYALSVQDKQISIVGLGTETVVRDTTNTPYTQTVTRIVVDMGPNDHGWYDEADNGTPGYRAIGFGFRLNPVAGNTQHWTGSGALESGDSKGWGRIAEAVTVSDMRGDICVCNSATSCDSNSGWASATDWTDDLVDGDRIFVSTLPESGDAKPTYMELRVLGDGPFDATKNETGSCPTGSVAVNIGGSTIGTSPTQVYGSQNLIVDGQSFVAHPRSGYWDVGGGLYNVVVVPQDYYDEAGGDCSGTGAWAFATTELSGDTDCDTGPLIGIWGAGAPRIQDVVLQQHHGYAIDGAGHTGRSVIERTTIAYGHGVQAIDPGNGWEMRDIWLLNNHFTDTALANFGHYQRWFGLRATGNTGVTLQNLTETMGNIYRDFVLEGNAFSLGYFTLNCGTQRNIFDNIRMGGNRRATAAAAAFILRCSDDTDPIAYNKFRYIEESPPGMAVVSGSDPSTVVDGQTLFYFDHFSGSVWVEDAIRNNLFEANTLFYDGGAGTDNSMFGIRSADGSEVLTTNMFLGNAVENGVLAGYCVSTDCSTTSGGVYVETGAIFYGNMVGGAEYP